jgi:cell division topological specificity factor
MRLLNRLMSRFKPRKSANIAKERLQIVVSHQRAEGGDADFLPKLRHELMSVISKYINIDQEQINVHLQRSGSCSVLELNITLPGDEAKTAH